MDPGRVCQGPLWGHIFMGSKLVIYVSHLNSILSNGNLFYSLSLRSLTLNLLCIENSVNLIPLITHYSFLLNWFQNPCSVQTKARSPPPPPLEEESVKEVLSETSTSIVGTHKIPYAPTSAGRGKNPEIWTKASLRGVSDFRNLQRLYHSHDWRRSNQ